MDYERHFGLRSRASAARAATACSATSRARRAHSRARGTMPSPTCRGRTVTVWCSNDYLGMGQHPVVLDAACAAVGAWAPAPAARATSPARPNCTCCWSASLPGCTARGGAGVHLGLCRQRGALSTIGRLLPGCVIFSDAENHASMIAGIRHAGCEKRIFRHNDVGAPRGSCWRRARPSAEADRLRVGLLDGRRYRPDRGDLRSRRALWRHDLSRRGPRGRAVRAAAAAASPSATA